MLLLSFWYKSNSDNAEPNVTSIEKLVMLLLNAAVRRIGVTVRQRRLLESDICYERGHNDCRYFAVYAVAASELQQYLNFEAFVQKTFSQSRPFQCQV
jgi:hypothetical protein